MKYIIIKANNELFLGLRVMTHIEMGWKPQGGVSVCTYGSRICFTQAMVKEEKETLNE